MSVTKEVTISADVFTCTEGGHNKYWVIFTCPEFFSWTATYYGAIGRKGKTTVKHSDPNSHAHIMGKYRKGYVREGSPVMFPFPEKLIATTKSTNSATGAGGNSVTSTDLLLEAFYLHYRKVNGCPPPCGSEAKRLFTQDGDAFKKASHMESLGFDPHTQELYEMELDLWETYTLLVD